MPLDAERASRSIINRGGTVLYTARSEEFAHGGGADRRPRTPASLLGIEGIVGIGGDGTFRGAAGPVPPRRVNVVGVPGTIDNDIGCSDYTIGFDTAANTAVECIDTSARHDAVARALLRGGGHGPPRRGIWRSMWVMAAGATAVLVPERAVRTSRRTSSAEIQPTPGSAASTHLHDRRGRGRGQRLWRSRRQLQEELGLDARVTVLGPRPARRLARAREGPRHGHAAWAMRPVQLLAAGKSEPRRLCPRRQHRRCGHQRWACHAQDTQLRGVRGHGGHDGDLMRPHEGGYQQNGRTACPSIFCRRRQIESP